MTRTPPLTPEAYRLYLQALAPDAVLGQRQMCWDCPMALWVSELRGKEVMMCTGHYIDERNRTHALPAWAQRFVAWADREAVPPITASAALAWLDEAAAQAQGEEA